MPKLKLVLVNVVVLSSLYGVVELPYSTYRYFQSSACPNSCWFYEHPGETVRFDPDRGYFLTRVPSRMGRITNRQLEWVGYLRGNAQGFADRDDFTLERLHKDQWRIAVFGDSFTSAQYILRNWPDRVEDSGAHNGRSLVLLNFSVDGAGLANWESVLRNVVVKDKYELDGILFAVTWDDLDRKFTVFDQVDDNTVAYARTQSWDITSHPRTLSEARALIKKNPHTYVVSPAEFDAAMSGQWKPPREWHFRISERIEEVAGRLLNHSPEKDAGFESGQSVLMQEIRRLADEKSLPIAVVYIPFRQELFDPAYPSNLERTRQFAEMLGATFIDGREAFRGLSSQQIRDDWFLYDGHWNLRGSDRFADFMTTQIPNWVEGRAGRATNGEEH